MILVRMNHRELTTESKRTRLSIMRFCKMSVLLFKPAHTMPYLIACFQQDLIVFAEGNTEDDAGDVLEAMDPLFAFTSLAADIKHANRSQCLTVPE